MIKVASVLAYIFLLLGAVRGGLGLVLAISFDDHSFAARRYLGAQGTGEAIDQGLVLFVVGVVLWLLVRILRSRRSA